MNFKRTRVALTSALLSAALFTAGVPTPAFAVPAELQQRVNDAYATLQQYTIDLELSNNQLYAVKESLSALEDEIAQTEADIAEKEQKVAEGQKTISERLSTSYKYGNATLLSVVLGASDFGDLFSRIFYADKIADRDAEVVEQVRRDMEELEQKKDELAAQKDEQEQLVSEQEAKTAEVEQRLNEQQSYYDGLDAELQQALADEAALAAAQEAARKAAEEAAKNEGNQNSGNSDNGSNSGNNSGNNNSNNNDNTPSTPSNPPVDTGNTDSGNAPSSVVDIALAQLGKPYDWGADGPNAFDCSGLVTYSYRQLGYSLPHSSQSQYNLVRSKGNLVYSASNLKPGDLVFWGTGGSGSRIYHVGIYIGGGKYVHAVQEGTPVSVSTLYTSGNFAGGGSPV